MKNFVEAIAKNVSNGFEFLSKKFPKFREAKLKKEIFVGFGKIGEVSKDAEFEKVLNTLKLRAWHAFK